MQPDALVDQALAVVDAGLPRPQGRLHPLHALHGTAARRRPCRPADAGAARGGGRRTSRSWSISTAGPPRPPPRSTISARWRPAGRSSSRSRCRRADPELMKAVTEQLAGADRHRRAADRPQRIRAALPPERAAHRPARHLPYRRARRGAQDRRRGRDRRHRHRARTIRSGRSPASPLCISTSRPPTSSSRRRWSGSVPWYAEVVADARSAWSRAPGRSRKRPDSASRSTRRSPPATPSSRRFSTPACRAARRHGRRLVDAPWQDVSPGRSPSSPAPDGGSARPLPAAFASEGAAVTIAEKDPETGAATARSIVENGGRATFRRDRRHPCRGRRESRRR